MWLFPFCRLKKTYQDYYCPKMHYARWMNLPSWLQQYRLFPKLNRRGRANPCQDVVIRAQTFSHIPCIVEVDGMTFWVTAEDESQMPFVLYPNFHYWEVHFGRANDNNHSFEDTYHIRALYIVYCVNVTKIDGVALI